MRFKVRFLRDDASAIVESVVEASSRESAIASAISRSFGSGDTGAASVAIAGAAPASAAEVLSAEPIDDDPLHPERAVWHRRLPWRRERLDVAAWCHELRTLIAAGMTAVEAIETLAAQQTGPAQQALHAQLIQSLGQGSALSAAMQATSQFPGILISGIKAGERSSELLAALDDYLRFDAMISTLRRKVVSAAIYPLMVAGLGFIITLFLLLFVLPRFSAMYSASGTDVVLSGTTSLVLTVSRFAAAHSGWLFGSLIALFLLLAWSVAVGAAAKAGRWLLESWAPLSRRAQDFRLAKLYQTLALMYRGGYALDEALGHAAALQLGSSIDTSVQAAAAALRRGQRVSTALGTAGLAEPVALRLLAVGERSGNFDIVLQAIAERHAQRFAVLLERTTRVVEPVMLLLVSLVVGSIVLMMYLPIFDLASSVR